VAIVVDDLPGPADRRVPARSLERQRPLWIRGERPRSTSWVPPQVTANRARAVRSHDPDDMTPLIAACAPSSFSLISASGWPVRSTGGPRMSQITPWLVPGEGHTSSVETSGRPVSGRRVMDTSPVLRRLASARHLRWDGTDCPPEWRRTGRTRRPRHGSRRLASGPEGGRTVLGAIPARLLGRPCRLADACAAA
jgi:hypothetical protein